MRSCFEEGVRLQGNEVHSPIAINDCRLSPYRYPRVNPPGWNVARGPFLNSAMIIWEWAPKNTLSNDSEQEKRVYQIQAYAEMSQGKRISPLYLVWHDLYLLLSIRRGAPPPYTRARITHRDKMRRAGYESYFASPTSMEIYTIAARTLVYVVTVLLVPGAGPNKVSARS